MGSVILFIYLIHYLFVYLQLNRSWTVEDGCIAKFLLVYSVCLLFNHDTNRAVCD